MSESMGRHTPEGGNRSGEEEQEIDKRRLTCYSGLK
jgi:hypothetical protein